MKRTFSQALLERGIAASKAGQRQDARRILLQVIELDPDNESAWLWLSGVMDSVEEQRHCLEQVLRLNPGNPHARAGLVWLEKQAAQTTPPPEADAPASVGTSARQDQDLETGDACPFCNKPVSVQRAICPHCHHDLIVICPICEARVDIEETVCGVCGYRLGDCRRGVAYYAALGDAYLANLKADPAVAAWQRVLEMNPNYPDAHLRLGEAQTVAGDLESARASFEQAIGRATHPVAAYLRLGSIYERRQKWDEAQKVYEQAVACDESSAAAQFTLGRLLMEGGRLQDAFPHILRATELDPEHAAAWFLRGRLYELAQERRKAIQSYERAMALAGHGVPDSDAPGKRAAERLELLRPSLPPSVALNWPETVRQTTGLVIIPALAALINGGLRPWQIAPLDFLGVLVAALGAYFWVSATAMPHNPGMRAMLGQDGLSQPILRIALGLLGGLFWTTGLLYILLAAALGPA
jgi:tetratricopeptide (TPR) repeat protein